jgi:hypothetical protein
MHHPPCWKHRPEHAPDPVRAGSLPAAFGNSGVFTLQPLQFADGEILEHVFDVSYNRLTGQLPAFLDFSNVPEYAQRGIYVSVRALPRFWLGICVNIAQNPEHPPSEPCAAGDRWCSWCKQRAAMLRCAV